MNQNLIKARTRKMRVALTGGEKMKSPNGTMAGTRW